ncbi:MAG: hypothetical protein ACXACY_13285 [Candidatus Hodarchaeales archaeon]|jgi:hypothetical protein
MKIAKRKTPCTKDRSNRRKRKEDSAERKKLNKKIKQESKYVGRYEHRAYRTLGRSICFCLKRMVVSYRIRASAIGSGHYHIGRGDIWVCWQCVERMEQQVKAINEETSLDDFFYKNKENRL